MELGKNSIANIEQADERLQSIVYRAVDELNNNADKWKISDFSVICSYRTTKKQFEYFKKNRILVNGVWTKVGKTVTNKDGLKRKSYHNYLPSYAIDVVPYPVDWGDINRFKELGRLFKYIAVKLNIPIEWGGEIWDNLKDYPHFQIPKAHWDD